jgi:ZIP family zinc transporter
MLIQQNLMMVVLITSIAASGTLIGALISYIMIHRHFEISKNKLNFIIALGGGLLFSAIALVLVPEGLKSLSFVWANSMFLAGSVTFMLLDIIIEHMGEKASQILANTLDSVPESIGIGAAFAMGGSVGVLLALLVGLQNIAEGFNSYIELKSGGMSTKSNFILQVLSAIAGPIGGILGFLFLAGHPPLISALFMFSAGGILYLIFHDIAPLAHREGHWVPTLGTAVGFMLGLASLALVGA